ncbi:MAG: DUF481 domain-containing protein [Longimicrobiales bacterium]
MTIFSFDPLSGEGRRPSAGRLDWALPALLALSTVLPSSGAAQVNVEPLRGEDPPEGTSGSLSSDLIVQTGNTDFVRIGVEGRLYIVEDSTTTLMVGNGGLGFLGTSRFASSGLFHYRKTYESFRWISPEWYGQVNYDRARNLRFRTVAGGGIRSPVVRGDWGHVGAGTGLMLEDERLALPDTADHPDHTTVVRSSSYGNFRITFEGGLVITSTTYLQPRLGRFTDIRILEDLAFSSPVTERLALAVSFDLRYDSVPPDGLAALDTRLRTGLTLTY